MKTENTNKTKLEAVNTEAPILNSAVIQPAEVVKTDDKIKVTVELIQGGLSMVKVNTSINKLGIGSKAQKPNVIGGTIAYKIALLRDKARKFKMNLGGFSFARKFDVKISIEGQSANGLDTYGLESSTIQFGLTLQDTNKSQLLFAEFIQDITNSILMAQFENEGEFIELMTESGLLAEPKVA